MYRALLRKELRETAWLTLPAAVVYLFFALDAMRLEALPEPFRSILFLGSRHGAEDIPFVSSRILTAFGWIPALLGMALGFAQTVGEARQGTYPVLLHLPL